MLLLPALAFTLVLTEPQGRAQAPPPDPGRLMARAVSLIVTCRYDVQASEEKSGVVKQSALSSQERAMQSRISLPILFRPGRYAFTAVSSGNYQGTNVWTVPFSPAASGQPGANPGEDERLNRAMNDLVGAVQIDKTTGAIVHVDASLKDTLFFSGVTYRFGIPAPVTVTVLKANLTVDQKLVGATWVPDRALLNLWAMVSWWMFAGPVHYSYPASFQCTK
jgi:hypothetical protein